MPVQTILWQGDHARLIDQTLLPETYQLLDIYDVPAMAEAIKSLRVRGAPAIGVAAALGVVISAIQNRESDKMVDAIAQDIRTLSQTRPTAVNLFWALDRMKTVLHTNKETSSEKLIDKLEATAIKIFQEDKQICRQMGKHGRSLLPDSCTVLTHCNAGGLATADFGTALGVIYAAHEAGKKVKVYADETRPLLQGARLTAWELQQSGIDVTVICDSMAAVLMQAGEIDCVIVGADRIAANGDAANKIGTYGLAVLAQYHKIPFYVAAPVSTIDFKITSGKDIPIEQRARQEIAEGFGRMTVPEDVPVFNPAFDVTPNALIAAIITEKGVLKPPFKEAIDGIKQ